MSIKKSKFLLLLSFSSIICAMEFDNRSQEKKKQQPMEINQTKLTSKKVGALVMQRSKPVIGPISSSERLKLRIKSYKQNCLMCLFKRN
jgi:hypothetical protein